MEQTKNILNLFQRREDQSFTSVHDKSFSGYVTQMQLACYMMHSDACHVSRVVTWIRLLEVCRLPGLWAGGW